ncbi:hypothetical protein H072_5577 [Dactylellina haptotyla CBS 200.50]|uniref:Uncharacterized protein n=1 Tax=Dactylellina haptotyla (strain CBS 200.50) TaxID=1284197 RepID=S8ACA3_DACHA|nr:hypothetical protein H072_5577 [Dactylellina haptotyla CBS 200.50]
MWSKSLLLSVIVAYGLIQSTVAGPLLQGGVAPGNGVRTGTVPASGPAKAAPAKTAAGPSIKLSDGTVIPAGYKVLKPIPKKKKTGVAKRAEAIKQALGSKRLDLNYGIPGDKFSKGGNVDIKIVSKDHPLVELEEFRPYLKDIQQGPKFAWIGVEFKTEADMKAAKQIWAWEDGKQGDYFFMILLYPDPNNMDIVHQDPFMVHRITPKPGKPLSMKLEIKKVKWEAVGDIDIRIGATVPQKAIDATNGGQKALPASGKAATPGQSGKKVARALIDKDLEWPFPMDSERFVPKEFNIFKKEKANITPLGIKGEFSIDCVECHTKGELLISAHIHKPWLVGTSVARVEITTRGVKATVAVESSLNLETTAQPWRKTILTIPFTPITILGFVSFGPQFDLEVYKEFKATGKFLVGAKVEATIPDDTLSLDLLNIGESVPPASNWKPEINWDVYADAKVEIKGVAGILASIGVKAQALGTSLGADVTVWVPRLEYGVKAIASTQFTEFCPVKKVPTLGNQKPLRMRNVVARATPTKDEKPTKAMKFGVSASASVGLKMEFHALKGTGLLSWVDVGHYEPESLVKMWPITNLCYEKDVTADQVFGKIKKLVAPNEIKANDKVANGQALPVISSNQDGAHGSGH